MPAMTFYSFPFEPQRVQATEARLEAIYDAAKMGLKGDSLALAAGITPAQYRKLAEFDPLVEFAETKGRADGEFMAGWIALQAGLAGEVPGNGVEGIQRCQRFLGVHLQAAQARQVLAPELRWRKPAMLRWSPAR